MEFLFIVHLSKKKKKIEFHSKLFSERTKNSGMHTDVMLMVFDSYYINIHDYPIIFFMVIILFLFHPKIFF